MLLAEVERALMDLALEIAVVAVEPIAGGMEAERELEEIVMKDQLESSTANKKLTAWRLRAMCGNEVCGARDRKGVPGYISVIFLPHKY